MYRYLSSCFFAKQLKIVTCWLVLLCAFSLTSNAYAGRILILGDSLSAAYNIPLESGWVTLLAQDLAPDFDVINASVSGETTGGGLARLPSLLEEKDPDWVIIELGGNDGLRGFPLQLIKTNLLEMGELAIASGAKPVFLGIRIPPNYGPRYTNAFEDIFPEVAEEMDAPFLDLFLERFYTEQGLLQEDGIHPTESAQPLIKAHIQDFLAPLLSK